MKKLWKMALLTILGTCIALCLGISAAADEGTIQNGLKQQFTWETDLAAGTMTITGEGQLPQNVHMEGEVYPWARRRRTNQDTDSEKGKIFTPTKYDYNVYYCHFLEKIVGETRRWFYLDSGCKHRHRYTDPEEGDMARRYLLLLPEQNRDF